MSEYQSRQEEILHAARQEFIKEGVSGARMQSIADNIGVTKAMIHYYFKTKDNLFQEVFRNAAHTLTTDLMDVLETQTPLFQKVEQFIDQALDRFHQNPQLVDFLVGELNRHPDITQPIIREMMKYKGQTFKGQLEEAAANYEIAPVNHDQVVVNILSLCMFPYSGQPFLQTVLSSKDESYSTILEQRREVVKDTIINWLAG